MTDTHLLVFGPGYSARAVMARARAAGWRISATARTTDKAEALADMGVTPIPFQAGTPFAPPKQPVTHVLASLAPSADRSAEDPVLAQAETWLRGEETLVWAGYLSSTNIYGDHDGAWVDETTPPAPTLDRGLDRLRAETAWRRLAGPGRVVDVFRLAGIYGPGRNAARSLRLGRARRVIKPGQVFSRIHVDDIGDAVMRAMGQALAFSKPPGGLETDGARLFNLADDMPAPPQDLITQAAHWMGITPPPEQDFDTADLPPMAASFYADCKRVQNRRAKDILGWQPLWPDWQSGLKPLAAAEKAVLAMGRHGGA
ncbi:SDR family NAD(P)-dependent oxidoreductase [Yunchengibacter salinarum]|uniref:SDR family NAD(P)-dependent oxidoreductase n=1 Tax=Yunchengibacter salinarum TaxID=3133399 RepID=UPI0035B5E309